jgi:hypothetical protein
MSLYGPTNGLSHSTPEAKLLSQKERSVSSRDEVSIRPVFSPPQSLPLYTQFLIVTLAMGLQLSATMRKQPASLQVAWSRQQRARLNYFSFRPPPASLPSY